ncbi:MAG: NAD(P)/FAD-dependent oxidoreductase [Candidatus Altiarchaeota archaeon]|nr:NAD(P)/FAD-dependent oxidoreductase [Candidatus Altiarchaeota archaeon]MBU4406027.1 NAD(P)/FAD-dependent oxidoreductase [Candidatus Altiarchaeota archaeon]MBU4436893.1 NAD(P)/FAD-dependent oxidoreductase [Candidatus Altiarchaeota archaeon]
MDKNRIIVVGAGISGLLTSLALAKEGRNVLVLEKSSDIGGVCRTYDVDGYQVDTGPHIITRVENGPLRELMDMYFDVVPNFVPHGRYYVRLNNKVKPFPWNLQGWFNFDLIPPVDRLHLVSALFSISYLFKSGEDLSKKSVGDLIGNNLCDSTMRFLNCLSYFMTGTSMKETPVQRFLDAQHYKSRSKNILDKLYNVLMKEGATDQFYPKGGIQSITNSVLSSMPKGKVKIKTNEEVKSIEDSDGKKKIQTTNGEYSAETVIYSGFASELPGIIKELPEGYGDSLKESHRADALTIWLGLNEQMFKRDGSEIWVDSDPYTWAVPVSNYDPSLAPKGKQLVGFAFRLPENYKPEKEKKRALNAIFEVKPKLEERVDITHYQILVPEKAAWTINTKFTGIKTPVNGIYLVGTDTEKRSMGITRASYSVLNLLSVLKEERVI